MKRARTASFPVWTKKTLDGSPYVAYWVPDADEELQTGWHASRILRAVKGTSGWHGQVQLMAPYPQLRNTYAPSAHCRDFDETTTLVPLYPDVSGVQTGPSGKITLPHSAAVLVAQYERTHRKLLRLDTLEVRPTAYKKAAVKPEAAAEKAAQNELIGKVAEEISVQAAIVLDAATMLTTRTLRNVRSVREVTVVNDSDDTRRIEADSPGLCTLAVDVIPAPGRLRRFLEAAAARHREFDCLVRDGCGKFNAEIKRELVVFVTQLALFPCMVSVTVNCRNEKSEDTRDELLATLEAIGDDKGVCMVKKADRIYGHGRQMVFVLVTFSRS